jgi:hypothetical protein
MEVPFYRYALVAAATAAVVVVVSVVTATATAVAVRDGVIASAAVVAAEEEEQDQRDDDQPHGGILENIAEATHILILLELSAVRGFPSPLLSYGDCQIRFQPSR